MSIQFGNLTIEEIEQRAGILFPEELKEFMKTTHQNEASNVQKGCWHCFDIPFFLVCGDMETALTIYNFLSPYSSSFKEPLQIGLS